jgi:hypothetical protein
MGDEEFVGPFPSWANVKSQYGAAGDGVTDDTAAIQRCLSALGASAPVCYFPAGTYLITSTLNIGGTGSPSTGAIYVSLIGADPATTSIVWGGPSGGTMLYLNGVAYSRFDRLTFNGQGNAGVAVDQSKADGTSNYFDTDNEYADDVFENAGTGLRCGNLGYGCAETSMLRDQFLNNTVAGVAMKNFNALDMFIWYSLFQSNYQGVTNHPGAGNFHVYNSIFKNSGYADMEIGNTGVFNIRNNYSSGSNIFLNADATDNPANITLQGNTILDTVLNNSSLPAVSIYIGDLGPVVAIDNVIRTRSGLTTGPVILAAGFTGSQTDLFSMGNIFTASSPERTTGHYHTIQDQIVAPSTINPTMPVLPGTPPNYNRTIFEASPTGSGTACTVASPCSVWQAITNAANAEQAGSVHPVAHIEPGTYSISSTITVPATVNSGIQIIGDGDYSQLTWTGTTAGPVIRLLGPNKAVLRNFMINGNNYTADGIEVNNADQAGSRVFMEEANLSQSRRNLFVDGLDHTMVELHDFYPGYNSLTGATNASVVVTGGPSAAAGLWQGGATNIFAGAASGNYVNYGVSNGAHFSVQGVWNDACCSQIMAADVTGTSTFSYAGSAINLPSGATVAISLHNFQGPAALVNLGTSGNIEITGNGLNAQVLGLGLVGPSATFFSNTSSPTATTHFLHGQTTAHPPPGTGASELAEREGADPTFLERTLNRLRTEQPTLLAPLEMGVTDTRFYRVSVARAATGIHLKAASTTPPPRPLNPKRRKHSSR